MTDRKFYHTILQVEVLSDEPPSELDLELATGDLDFGGMELSGKFKIVSSRVLDGIEAARVAVSMSSEPELLDIDHDGNDLESEDE